jgi:hypothetical membrane protein
VRLRSVYRSATATQLAFTTTTVVGLGILASILTTPDPLWWQLHFSRLGTFNTFSGHAFNLTIIFSGVLVMLFGLRLRIEMARHAGTAVLVSRRGAVIVPVLVVVIGAHLSLIGLVPVNTNEFLHDRGSIGALCCFAAILASRRWLLRGMHRVIARATRRVGIALVVSTGCFIPGWINLAAFELVVFSLMFAWFLCLARTIGRPAEEPSTTAPHRVVVRSSGAVAAASRRRLAVRAATLPGSVRSGRTARRLPTDPRDAQRRTHALGARGGSRPPRAPSARLRRTRELQHPSPSRRA